MTTLRFLLSLGLALVVFTAFASTELSQITVQTKLTAVIDDLEDEIREHLLEEERAAFYDAYYEAYGLLDGFNVNTLLSMLGKPYADNGTCQMCNSLIGLGRSFLTTKEVLVGLIGGICKDSNSLSKRTCLGLVERMADPLVWLFVNSKLATPEICSLLVGHGCLGFLNYSDNKTITWELPLPPKREYTPLPAKGKNLKILHLTDIHMDLWYTPKSAAHCNEPLCCRSTSHDTRNASIHAGFWGQVDGDCDVPEHYVMDSLKQIAARHPDIDAVFWTGDNVPHDVWNTTQQINLRHIHTATGFVNVVFNGKPIFPVLGNHETHPINMYIPTAVREKDSNQSMVWLYETLAKDYWNRWLEDDEAQKTFQKGGYYSRMANPGWKVIVLNSNIAQKQNFWILYDPVDPDGQLAWLIQELDHAESIGARVTILGHVPPKHENYDAWVHNYIRIMDRYQHVITGTFYGHTHKDEVAVLYNQEKAPVSVVYISGSLTTYSDLNPSYAIFTTDSQGTPLDSHVYLTDLDADNAALARNASSTPQWRFEYSAKEAYKLIDMTPASWDAFVRETESDLDLAFLYTNHYHRFSKEYARKRSVGIESAKELVQGAKRYSPFMHLEKNTSDN